MSESINEKIHKAHGLANRVGDILNAGKLAVDAETLDMVWGHADGLTAKHLYNMRDGRCSIAASLAFDTEVAEQRLDSDIKKLQELLSKVDENKS